MYSPPNEIFYIKEKENSLLFSDKEIKIKEFHEDSGYGIRVLCNNKIGFAYCEHKKDIKSTLEQASKVAKFKVENFSFPAKLPCPKMNIIDNTISNIDEQKLKEMIYMIKEGLEKYTNQCRVSINAGEIEVNIQNSSGLDSQYIKTGLDIYAEAMLGDGFGSSYFSSIFLPKDFVVIGEEAGKMAKHMQKAKKPVNGNYIIVLEPESLNSMLEVLLPSFSGDWKRRNISFLGNKLGKKFFSEQLSIYDDGTAIASSSRPFDDEGSISKKIPLVENGVIKNFLYDIETASLDNVNNCGSCSRNDYFSSPVITHSNILIRSGDYNNFENELDEFIIVKSLHGTHTSNMTTGDFGVEVNAGFHYKQGNIVPVRGFIISGNIFNLFNSIKGMEKDSKTFYDLITPRIAFDNMQIVGK